MLPPPISTSSNLIAETLTHVPSTMSGRLGVSDFPDTPPGHPHWGPPRGETGTGNAQFDKRLANASSSNARKLSSTATYTVPSTRSSSSADSAVSGISPRRYTASS